MKRFLFILTASLCSTFLMAQTEAELESARVEFPYSVFAIEELYDFETGMRVRQPFTEYVKYDIDGDGQCEVMVRTADGKHVGIFSDTETDLYLFAYKGGDYLNCDFFEHAAYAFTAMGTAKNAYGIVSPVNSIERYVFLTNSVPSLFLEIEQNYNEKTLCMDTTYKIDGKRVSAKRGKRQLEKVGRPLEHLQWKPIPEALLPKG